jgi:hypothetical protein
MSKSYKIVDASLAEKSLLPSDIADGKQSEVSAEELESYTGIKGAQKELGLGYSQYVRRLLLQGKLEGIKVAHSHYNKWYVYRPSIEAYTENHRRTEQARRFILRAELEDREAIEAALEAAGIEYTLELAYKGKSE